MINKNKQPLPSNFDHSPRIEEIFVPNDEPKIQWRRRSEIRIEEEEDEEDTMEAAVVYMVEHDDDDDDGQLPPPRRTYQDHYGLDLFPIEVVTPQKKEQKSLKRIPSSSTLSRSQIYEGR
ncbi:hypothetical protein M5K25_005400 [Dendrobium thyrsiflorum]|uniref:Uncharacterized protein n=1 Tax=Dendrobium thyrsiflorum TaxID=117978 RepID=A0ABD0VPN5_DENTH